MPEIAPGGRGIPGVPLPPHEEGTRQTATHQEPLVRPVRPASRLPPRPRDGRRGVRGSMKAQGAPPLGDCSSGSLVVWIGDGSWLLTEAHRKGGPRCSTSSIPATG